MRFNSIPKDPIIFIGDVSCDIIDDAINITSEMIYDFVVSDEAVGKAFVKNVREPITASQSKGFNRAVILKIGDKFKDSFLHFSFRL